MCSQLRGYNGEYVARVCSLFLIKFFVAFFNWRECSPILFLRLLNWRSKKCWCSGVAHAWGLRYLWWRRRLSLQKSFAFCGGFEPALLFHLSIWRWKFLTRVFLLRRFTARGHPSVRIFLFVRLTKAWLHCWFFFNGGCWSYYYSSSRISSSRMTLQHALMSRQGKIVVSCSNMCWRVVDSSPLDSVGAGFVASRQEWVTISLGERIKGGWIG